MSHALFLSQASVYQDDYSCILRNPQNEFDYGLHYHDSWHRADAAGRDDAGAAQGALY